jgi:hypothetical protein
MADNIITVRLVGADEDNGVVRFDDFREFCDNLARCLRKSESIVSTQQPRLHYRIRSLEGGSACVTLEALPPTNGPDHRQETLSLFRNTVVRLQQGQAVDTRLNTDAIESFRGLVSPLRRKTKEVWVDQSRLTTQFEANIEHILGSSVPSEGSVSGILERVNVHNKREFVLYPPIPGHSIKCVFPDELFDQVRAAIKGNVTVSGMMYFYQDKPFPDTVHVREMELHPPDDDLSTFGSLRGFAPNCSGSMESVEYVRSIRDEQ